MDSELMVYVNLKGSRWNNTLIKPQITSAVSSGGKKHNLKVENYVLLEGFAEDLSLGGSSLDSSEGLS